MTSKFREIVPPFHRQGNGIPSAAIRWPDLGDRPSFGRPFIQIFRHSDTPLLSFSPGRRFPRPTPERRQRPVLDFLPQRQCAQEVAEVISEHMELEPDRKLGQSLIATQGFKCHFRLKGR